MTKVVVQTQGANGLRPAAYHGVSSIQIEDGALIVDHAMGRKVFASGHWKEYDETQDDGRDLLTGIQKGAANEDTD